VSGNVSSVDADTCTVLTAFLQVLTGPGSTFEIFGGEASTSTGTASPEASRIVPVEVMDFTAHGTACSAGGAQFSLSIFTLLEGGEAIDLTGMHFDEA
jgi:hypothetical protein